MDGSCDTEIGEMSRGHRIAQISEEDTGWIRSRNECYASVPNCQAGLQLYNRSISNVAEG